MFDRLVPPKASTDVRREQIYLLYDQGNSIQILGWLTAIISLWVFWNQSETDLLLIWFAALTILTLVRMSINVRFKISKPDVMDIEKWGMVYVAGTFLSGIAWGSLAYFFDVQWPVMYQVILFAIFTGLIAGSFNSNSAFFPAFPAFYFPIVISLGIIIAQFQGHGYLPLLILLSVYILQMYISALKYNKHLMHALQMRFENEELAEKLVTVNEKLSNLADKDELTQLFNRRSFDRNLQLEWSKHYLSRSPFSLLFIDVDYFKNYNDTYGHDQGDVCLKEIASILKTNAKRADDMAARYGGEEFAVILPNTSQVDAEKIAKNIHDDLSRMSIEHKSSEISSFVTLSIGVVTVIPKEDEGFKDLLRQSDKALYCAKKFGRNRTVIYYQDEGDNHECIEAGI